MIIEIKDLLKQPIFNQSGDKVGQVVRPIFEGNKLSLYGFVINKTGLLAKGRYLRFDEIVGLYHDSIMSSDKAEMPTQDVLSSKVEQKFGKVLGATAVTQDKKHLGKIVDVYVDTQTGAMVRFLVKNLLKEVIIPANYVVVVTPRQIVFKNTVNEPIFNQEPSLAEAITQ